MCFVKESFSKVLTMCDLQKHDRVRENLLISVESPQFHTSYTYSYDLENNRLAVLT